VGAGVKGAAKDPARVLRHALGRAVDLRAVYRPGASAARARYTLVRALRNVCVCCGRPCLSLRTTAYDGCITPGLLSGGPRLGHLKNIAGTRRRLHATTTARDDGCTRRRLHVRTALSAHVVTFELSLAAA
jgi:hypothetical protein